MSNYDINTEILLFLEKSLKKTVLNFLPKKEIPLLPPNYLQVNTPEVFFDYIFVIEKLLSTHVIPDYYSPLYSTKIIPFLEDVFIKDKINRIVKYFETGDKMVNDKSVNILPKSSYRYFNDTFSGKKRRYVIDYECDDYGIRHTHLTGQNDDCLLFYVLTNKNVILLNIGNHKDIHKNNNLRILLYEYPEFLDILGIHELTGISPGIEEGWEEIKMGREKGVSSLPTIDGKTYSMPMAAFRSFSGTNFAIHNIFQNIIFQVNNASIKILKSIGKEHNLYVKRAKSKLSIEYGYIYVGDRLTNKEWAINIPYFEKYRLIKMVISHLV
jgi:hypothetical protein